MLDVTAATDHYAAMTTGKPRGSRARQLGWGSTGVDKPRTLTRPERLVWSQLLPVAYAVIVGTFVFFTTDLWISIPLLLLAVVAVQVIDTRVKRRIASRHTHQAPPGAAPA